LRVLLVLYLKLFSQLEVDFHHFFFVDGLLLDIQVVHNEEVLCARWLQVNTIDLLERGHAVVNNISIVVLVVKDVLRRVHEHLELTGNPDLEGNKEDVLLLVEDHTDVLELEALELVALQGHFVQLVVGTRLVVVRPHFFLLKNFYHFNLLFHKLLVIVALGEDIRILSQLYLHWFAHLFEVGATLLLHQLNASVVGHLVVEQLCKGVIWLVVIIALLIVILDGV